GDGKGAALAEGQAVAAGQGIVQLDDRIPRANRDKLQAAQADLKEQKNQAEDAVGLARPEVRRLEKLLPRRRSREGSGLPLVSRIELDRARIALKDAESKQKSVAAREAAGAAELRSLEEQLHLYTLRAPIAGRLGLLQVAVGQTLPPGTPVTEVMDLDEI